MRIVITTDAITAKNAGSRAAEEAKTAVSDDKAVVPISEYSQTGGVHAIAS